MIKKENEKFINILLFFYVIGSINFIYYGYSKVVNLSFICIGFFYSLFLIIRKKIIYFKILLFWTVLCLEILISIIISQYTNEIFTSALQFITLTIITVFIIINTYNDYTQKILDFFVIYAVILCIYSIFMYILFPNIKTSQWGLKANQFKIFGFEINQLIYGFVGNYGYASFTNNPNSFGFISAIGFNVLNSKYYRLKNKKSKKYIKVIFNFLIISGIFLSKSRGALIIVFLIMYFQFVLSDFLKNKFSAKFWSVNIITLIIFLIIYKYNNEIIINFFTNISDTNGRIEIWSILIETAKNNNPLIGIGYGSISNVIVSGTEIASYSAFNTYISVFVESGIIGISFVVIWILYTLMISYKNIKIFLKMNKNLLEMEILVISILLGVYVISFVENKFMNSSLFHLIWITLTINIIKRHSINNKKYKINH